MTIRKYNREIDQKAVHRIWHEIGWLDGTVDDQIKGLDEFLDSGNVRIAEVHGEAECMVATHPCRVRHLSNVLEASAVTAVTVGHAGRKQGLAGQVTARAIVEDAANGAAISALGMFEQGFYNRLGFGTGGYVHQVAFDPAHLAVDRGFRAPKRLTTENAAEMHAARLRRMPWHGACSLPLPAVTSSKMQWEGPGFGLGYYDGPNGELSHYFWATAGDREYGPYHLHLIVYETGDQLMELLALLRGLGDQVRLMRTLEPVHVQLQDLIHRPIAHRVATKSSPYQGGVESLAFWQMRICDVESVFASTRLACPEFTFSLELTDPIESRLDGDVPWRGVAGNYVVTIGETCVAERETDYALPTLSASVNALTRMWLGVLPASSLAITDDLTAEEDLLQELDAAFRLPTPKVNWEF